MTRLEELQRETHFVYLGEGKVELDGEYTSSDLRLIAASLQSNEAAIQRFVDDVYYAGNRTALGEKPPVPPSEFYGRANTLLNAETERLTAALRRIRDERCDPQAVAWDALEKKGEE